MRYQHRFYRLIGMVVGLLALAAEGQSAIEIGKDCGYTIVVSTKANAVTRFAAKELQTYARRITGAELPIRDDSESLTSIRKLLLIGDSTYTQDMGVALNDPTPEAFLLKSVDDCLILLGDDRPEEKGNGLIPFSYFYSRKGSIFAVYELLERFAGVRWFFPGPAGEVVPTADFIVIPSVDVQDRPDMPVRWYWGSSSTNTNDTFDVPETVEAHRALWLMRIRQGMTMELGFRAGFSHSWSTYMEGNKHFDAHPEYYAYLNGSRQKMYTHADGSPKNSQNQVCTSNPDVVKLFVERIRSMYSPDDDCVVSIGPNDGGGFCQCEKCKALDHPELYGPDDGYRGTVLSDRIYTFANQVAREVKKTHPKLKLGILAYTYYRNPPKMIDLLESNLRIKFVEQPESYYGNTASRSKTRRWLDQWAQRVSGGILISEHYDDQVRVPVSRFLPLVIENTRFLASRKVLGFSMETHRYLPCRHLDYYVMSKMMWNSTLDAEALINDYCTSAFGAAGPAMRRYVDFMNATFAERMREVNMSANPGSVPYLWLPEDIQEGFRLLDAADAAADSDAVRRRLAFVRKGQTFLRLFRDVAAGCITMDGNGFLVNMVGMKNYPKHHLSGTLGREELAEVTVDTFKAYNSLVSFLDAGCTTPGLDPRTMWHVISTRGDLRAIAGHAAVVKGAKRLVEEGFEAGRPRGWRINDKGLKIVQDTVATGKFAAYIDAPDDKGTQVLKRLVGRLEEGKQYVVGMTYRHMATAEELVGSASKGDVERWIQGPTLVVRKRSSTHGSLLSRHGADCRPQWICASTRSDRTQWTSLQQVINTPTGVDFTGLYLQVQVPPGQWWLDDIFLAEVD